jgi:hypothetical protein
MEECVHSLTAARCPDHALSIPGEAAARRRKAFRGAESAKRMRMFAARARSGALVERFKQAGMGLFTHTEPAAAVRRFGHRQRSTSELESTTGNDSQVTPAAARAR